MNSLYDFFCLAAAQHHVQIFHGVERTKFTEDCNFALSNYNRCVKRGRNYTPRFSVANAPIQMQKYILRLFAGGYNTLYDSATSWIEPTEQALYDAVDALEDNNVIVTNEEFIDLFNAWVLSICDTSTAIGHTINEFALIIMAMGWTRIGIFQKKFVKLWAGKKRMKPSLLGNEC